MNTSKFSWRRKFQCLLKILSNYSVLHSETLYCSTYLITSLLYSHGEIGFLGRNGHVFLEFQYCVCHGLVRLWSLGSCSSELRGGKGKKKSEIAGRAWTSELGIFTGAGRNWEQKTEGHGNPQMKQLWVLLPQVRWLFGKARLTPLPSRNFLSIEGNDASCLNPKNMSPSLGTPSSLYSTQ